MSEYKQIYATLCQKILHFHYSNAIKLKVIMCILGMFSCTQCPTLAVYELFKLEKVVHVLSLFCLQT